MARDQDIVGQLQRRFQWDTTRNSCPHLYHRKRWEYDEEGRLIRLHLCDFGISQFPTELSQFTSLKELFLAGNRFSSFPTEVRQFSFLRRLDLDDNQLTSLPPELGQLSSLEQLGLSKNQLTSLPPEVGQLSSLRILYLGSNQLTSLPPELGQLSSLRELHLEDNQLTSLPPELGQLSSLEELDVQNNQLTSLPPELGQLSSLGTLWFYDNPLRMPPPEITDQISIGESTEAILAYLRALHQAEDRTIRVKNEEMLEKPLHVFCCYARNDQLYLFELKKRLIPLQRDGLIVLHADIDISPGEEWEQKIHHYLNTAHIILLLVSADFIASEYIYSEELVRALKRHHEGKSRVIPIILRPVDLRRTPFGQIQSLPTDAKPISMWINQDVAFLDVVNGIDVAIENLLSRSQADLLLAQQASTLQKQVEQPIDPSVSPTTFRTLAGTAQASTWDSHNAYLAIGHNDGQIQIWEVSSGRLVCTCWGHTDWVRDVTWSPNGTQFASLSRDKTIRIWNARTGQTLAFASKSLDKTGDDYLRWSLDGTRLAALAGEEGIIRVYNVTTGQLITSYEVSREVYHSMEWSPDSTRIALSVGSQSIQIIDANTGKTISTYTHFATWEHTKIAWSPDGVYLLFGGNKRVHVLNVLTQEIISPYQDQGSSLVLAVAYSSKGTYLTFTSGESILFWETATKQLTSTVRKNKGITTGIKWSPDETHIASSSRHGRVLVVEIATGKISAIYDDHDATVRVVRYSPDGTLIASGSADTTVQVWNAQTGNRLSLYTGHKQSLHGLAWSPDGTRIASCDHLEAAIHVWSVATGQLISTYTGHDRYVNALAWSPDGTRIASTDGNRTCHIWHTSTGHPVSTRIENLDDEACTVVWSPDGTRIATCNCHAFAAWSPDGTRIASGLLTDIWNARTGKRIFTYTDREGFSTKELVYVWNVTTRETLTTCEGHSSRIGTVAWSPDGTRIASGSWDRTVQIWNAATGKHITTYNGYSGEEYGLTVGPGVAWSPPDGKYLAFSADAIMVHIWKAI